MLSTTLQLAKRCLRAELTVGPLWVLLVEVGVVELEVGLVVVVVRQGGVRVLALAAVGRR